MKKLVAASVIAATGLTAAPVDQPATPQPITPAQLSDRQMIQLYKAQAATKPKIAVRRHKPRLRRTKVRVNGVKAVLLHRRNDPTSARWAALRQCESGGNYRTETGNGFYGAYQFDLNTWADYGPPGDPAKASPAEQDRRALACWRARGWQPWPVCGRRVA